MKILIKTILVLGFALIINACNSQPSPDQKLIMKDISFLASEELEGRLTGTTGNKKAREFIIKRFKEIGLKPIHKDYQSSFIYDSSNSINGVNLIGKIDGRSDKVIIISAHYDHIGVIKGKIYNGADDNASGVAGILSIANYFSKVKPTHTLIFVAFDAEEEGLRGARAFVKNLPISKEIIKLNINLDMISRSDKNEIYAAGTYHYPQFKEILEQVAASASVTLSLGHDSPELKYDDWTSSSDHGPFHKAGIPFIYFGVEDHPDYHKHTDTADKINPEFIEGTVTLILETVKKLDQSE